MSTKNVSQAGNWDKEHLTGITHGRKAALLVLSMGQVLSPHADLVLSPQGLCSPAPSFLSAGSSAWDSASAACSWLMSNLRLDTVVPPYGNKPLSPPALSLHEDLALVPIHPSHLSGTPRSKKETCFPRRASTTMQNEATYIQLGVEEGEPENSTSFLLIKYACYVIYILYFII